MHVTPRASRNEVVGWRGAELQVRVTAPPEDGKANAAVEKVLAEALGTPKSAVRVVRGHSARTKSVAVEGIAESGVYDVFGEPDAPLW